MPVFLKTFYQPNAHNDFVWIAVGSPWGLLAIWLLLINIVTFFAFGLDKWKAKRKETNSNVRRIPEKTLFLLAWLGGGAGALLGMRVWHHKTLHKSFRFGIPLILALEILVPLGLWIYWKWFR